MLYELLKDNLLISPDVDSEFTESGLLIKPENADPIEDFQTGRVLQTGQGMVHKITGERIPMEVSVDDRVLYHKHVGSAFNIDGEIYRIIKESEVLAIL